MALLWFEKELEIDRCCVGDDHPDVTELVRMMNHLEAAQLGSHEYDQALSDYFARSEPAGTGCMVM